MGASDKYNKKGTYYSTLATLLLEAASIARQSFSGEQGDWRINITNLESDVNHNIY